MESDVGEIAHERATVLPSYHKLPSHVYHCTCALSMGMVQQRACMRTKGDSNKRTKETGTWRMSVATNVWKVGRIRALSNRPYGGTADETLRRPRDARTTLPVDGWLPTVETFHR